MYITINNIKGLKSVYLTYPIQNFYSNKGIAVVDMFSDNTQYKLKKSLIVSKDILGVINKISDGSYTGRELKSFTAGIISPVKYAERVEKTNNLLNITELNLNLNELDNTR